MDSALLLQTGALYLPSTMSVTRVSRLHTSFNPSSLSLSSSNGSTHRALPGHAFSPVISAVNGRLTPSTNDKDDKKSIVRGMGAASVVLACVLGIINCNYKFTPRAIAAPWTSPISQYGAKQDMLQPKSKKDVLEPTSKKDVLQWLLMVDEHVASSESGKLSRPPPRPDKEYYEDLKIKAAGLIKAGKGDEAVRQLQDIYKGTQKNIAVAYEVEMVLAAVLIFQGNYQDASKCDCLNNSAISSDRRVDLYKAICHTMLAKESWDKVIAQENEGVPNPTTT